MTIRIHAAHPADLPIHDRPRRSPRALTPFDSVELAQRRRAGWSVEALMACYGISRRSVYRYAAAHLQLVRVGDWEAMFQINERSGSVGGHPVRIGLWQRVEDAA